MPKAKSASDRRKSKTPSRRKAKRTSRPREPERIALTAERGLHDLGLHFVGESFNAPNDPSKRAFAQALQALWLAHRLPVDDEETHAFLQAVERAAYRYFSEARKVIWPLFAEEIIEDRALIHLDPPPAPNLNMPKAVAALLWRVDIVLKLAPVVRGNAKTTAAALHDAAVTTLPTYATPSTFDPVKCNERTCKSCQRIEKVLVGLWYDGKLDIESAARAALRAFVSSAKAWDILKAALPP